MDNQQQSEQRLRSERQKLEKEAESFRLPSELLPQVFKYIFFIGLGFLNYRLFAHTVPGFWGTATGIVAMMAEAIALYAAHYFSRSAGAFRIALGVSGFFLMVFSLVHGTFSVFDLIGTADVFVTIDFYARTVAFPLLAGLLGLSVISITMTHPINIIRLKQAAAHTRIAIARAEAASKLELMRAQSVLAQARIDHQRERSMLEEQYLAEMKNLITIEERKADMVGSISNPALREKMASKLGVKSSEHDWSFIDGSWEESPIGINGRNK